MQEEVIRLRSVDLKPLVDMLEPPKWWLQLWADHTEVMSLIALTLCAFSVLFLLAFHTFVWLLRTGRIPEIERLLSEWDICRMNRKDKCLMDKQTERGHHK